jgi:hypothetical protein
MIKKMIYKIDKQLRPKKRFFDKLENIDKSDPRSKDILKFIKENMNAHNKQVFSGRADGVRTFRNLKDYEKYDLLADFYLKEYRLSVLSDANIYNLSRKFRTRVANELFKANRFNDGFSYSKKHKLLESEIIKDALAEIDRNIKETELAIKKNPKKEKKLLKDLNFSLSFYKDYAKANNYSTIDNQLNERINKLSLEHK